MLLFKFEAIALQNESNFAFQDEKIGNSNTLYQLGCQKVMTACFKNEL